MPEKMFTLGLLLTSPQNVVLDTFPLLYQQTQLGGKVLREGTNAENNKTQGPLSSLQNTLGSYLPSLIAH